MIELMLIAVFILLVVATVRYFTEKWTEYKHPNPQQDKINNTQHEMD